jgi:translation initiation factor IF-2
MLSQELLDFVSAKTKEGLENLLEMILLVADMQVLKANPHKNAAGAQYFRAAAIER